MLLLVQFRWENYVVGIRSDDVVLALAVQSLLGSKASTTQDHVHSRLQVSGPLVYAWSPEFCKVTKAAIRLCGR